MIEDEEPTTPRRLVRGLSGVVGGVLCLGFLANVAIGIQDRLTDVLSTGASESRFVADVLGVRHVCASRRGHGLFAVILSRATHDTRCPPLVVDSAHSGRPAARLPAGVLSNRRCHCDAVRLLSTVDRIPHTLVQSTHAYPRPVPERAADLDTLRDYLGLWSNAIVPEVLRYRAGVRMLQRMFRAGQ